MNILCDVDQALCLRLGVNAPSSTVKLDINPKALTEEQRDFIADNLYRGLRFPLYDDCNICPPGPEGFLAAVNYGLEKKRLYPTIADWDRSGQKDEKLKTFRMKLIKAAVAESEKRIASERERHIASERERYIPNSTDQLKALQPALEKSFGAPKQS